MAMNIKNAAVEALVEDVVRVTGETKTEAIRKALEERRERLTLRAAGSNREALLMRFLEEEIWPTIPKKALGRKLTKRRLETILGYGKEGV